MPEPAQHDEATSITVEPLDGGPPDHASPRLSVRARLLRAAAITLAIAVAAVALLPHGSLTIPPGIASLLTPAPTATPWLTTFATGQWVAIATPTVPGHLQLVPAPDDPDTAYACISSSTLTTSGVPEYGPVTVWATQNAGVSWRQAYAAMGTGCVIGVANNSGSSLALTVLNDATGADGAGTCARATFLHSTDGGQTWDTVPHSPLSFPGAESVVCSLWPTVSSLFLVTDATFAGPAESVNALEVTGDQGQNWLRLGTNLPPGAQVMLGSLGQLRTFAVQYPDRSQSAAPGVVQAWVSRDGGLFWARFAELSGDSDLQVIYSDATGTGLCNCTLGISNRLTPQSDLSLQLWLSHGSRWTPAPTIPAQTTPSGKTGLFRWLGITPDGRALALGVPPTLPNRWTTGTGTPTAFGAVLAAYTPRMWAYDMRAQKWSVATAAGTVPCRDVDSCYLSALGVATTATGAYIWVIDDGPSASNAVYRVFVPNR
ncbi:MAG TPA: hypothetical protein VF807_10250 [Ktedonobacterales bacterium]